MITGLVLLVAVVTILVITLFSKRSSARRELDEYTITAEQLHGQIQSGKSVRLYDIRQSLDILANPIIIPGSERVTPSDLEHNPGIIPIDEDVIVYCTCATDLTAQRVIHRALSMHYTRARLLRGGLEAWRDKGYTTESYDMSLHLEMQT